MGEGLGVRVHVSNSIRLQATGIYMRAMASRSREIAADIQAIATDIEEIGIYVMEIAADSRETGIYWSEIATYSQESTPTFRKRPVNIGEIGIYSRRTPTCSLAIDSNS